MVQIPTDIGHVCKRCVERVNGRYIDFFAHDVNENINDQYLSQSISSKESLWDECIESPELSKKELECCLCAGLLYLDRPESKFFGIVRKAIADGGYEGLIKPELNIEVVLPTNLIFREYCFKALVDFPGGLIELKDAVRACVSHTAVQILKDDGAMFPAINASLPEKDASLDILPTPKSFHLRIEFNHSKSAAEVEPFQQFNKAAYQRVNFKDNKRRRVDPNQPGSGGRGPVSAATISDILKKLNRQELECMVASATHQAVLTLQDALTAFPDDFAFLTKAELYRDVAHFYGCYTKISRMVSQCAWIRREAEIRSEVANQAETANSLGDASPDNLPGGDDDDVGLSGLMSSISPENAWMWSVEGILGKIFKEETGCDSITLVASGREDVDVRMLGNGRPFCVLLKNCRRVSADPQWCAKLEKRMCDIGEGKIGVSGIKFCTSAIVKEVHNSSETHRKVYRCVVWTKNPVASQAELDEKLLKESNFRIQQNTPVRVLHRRAALKRPRMVYWMKPVWINSNFFVLTLETQAGTYIKEFVHGDLGRTTPSVRSILGCDADILQLDVMGLVDN